VFARLGQIARSEIPQLPPGASLPEAKFSDALRLVERAGLSFAALGFFGLAALAGTTRMLRNGLSIANVTATAVAAERKLGPAALAPTELEYHYPCSVIPGGVRSVEEFRQAISADSQVAAHYADFDFTRARIFTLDRDSAYYVSYRLESGVFWTTERIFVRRGESLVTDGASLVQARSGSRLSEVPRFPVSSLEPTASELDATDIARGSSP
jgi:hypothetical protein